MNIDETRYVLEYVSKEQVGRVHDAHELEISQGASVWDFASIESLTVEISCSSEKEAFNMAEKLLHLDEFGEIHITKQIKETEILDDYTISNWINVETSVFCQGDVGLKWISLNI